MYEVATIVSLDRNECNNTSAVKVCEHDCHNLPGSYNCSCHVGYSLNTDKKTCSGKKRSNKKNPTFGKSYFLTKSLLLLFKY